MRGGGRLHTVKWKNSRSLLLTCFQSLSLLQYHLVRLIVWCGLDKYVTVFKLYKEAINVLDLSRVLSSTWTLRQIYCVFKYNLVVRISWKELNTFVNNKTPKWISVDHLEENHFTFDMDRARTQSAMVCNPTYGGKRKHF